MSCLCCRATNTLCQFTLFCAVCLVYDWSRPRSYCVVLFESVRFILLWVLHGRGLHFQELPIGFVWLVLDFQKLCEQGLIWIQQPYHLFRPYGPMQTFRMYHSALHRYNASILMLLLTEKRDARLQSQDIHSIRTNVSISVLYCFQSLGVFSLFVNLLWKSCPLVFVI